MDIRDRRHPRRRAATALLVAASIAACALPASAQSQWTDLGCDLPGALGSPVLTGSGPLTAGSANQVQLDNAAGDALAMLFLALEQNPVAFKGGTLKPVPFLNLPLLTTTPSGEIDIPFSWPAGLPDGLPFYLQYAVQDAGAPVNVALSNALRGVTPGPAVVDSFSSTDIDVGDTFSISGVNLGSSENDICMLLVDEAGQTVGFTRAQSVRGNSVTTQVGSLRPGATTAQLMLNTGSGAIVPPTALPGGVTVLDGGSWVFSSDPSTAVMVEQQLDLFPQPGNDASSYSGGANFYQYLHSELTSNGWLELEMPQGDCPPGTTISFQLDACSDGGTLSLDYYVALQNSTTLDALTCATLICQEFQLAVLSQLGVLVTCIPVQVGSQIFLRVLPPPGETWKAYSGAYFSVCFPTVDCQYYYGDLLGSGLIELTLPLSTPDDAATTIYVDGYSDLGTYAWAFVSTILPAGPSTPLAVATAAAAAVQDSFDDAGISATAAAAVVGSDVRIQITPPTSETWTWGWMQMEICELQ